MARRPRRRGTELGALARASVLQSLEELQAMYGHLLEEAGEADAFETRAAQLRDGEPFEVHGWEIKDVVQAVDVDVRYLISSSDLIRPVDDP